MPVLFLPLADGADSMPVRIKNITIDDGKLRLAFVPLKPAERAALLEKLRARIELTVKDFNYRAATGAVVGIVAGNVFTRLAGNGWAGGRMT